MARKTRLKRNGRPVPWSKTHEVVAEHLSAVQWGPSSDTDAEIETLRDWPHIDQATSQPPKDFTMEELDYAIARLKKNKAPGPDEVRAEIILLPNYWGQQELLKIVNQCFREQKVSQSCKETLIVSIYKGKGADSDPANYRPISLLNTLYKIYAALLQIRLSAEKTITYVTRTMRAQNLSMPAIPRRENGLRQGGP